MTQTKGAATPSLAEQVLSTFESLIDEMVQRAVARHTPTQATSALWIDAREASELLGAGYPPGRVKQLGHEGEIVMDRREPGKDNSHYIFERQSVLNYSARRVFQLDQKS